MAPLFISFYLIAASTSLGLLIAIASRRKAGLLEAFSLGLSLILVGGLAFYERAAFEYYTYLLAIFPITLAILWGVRQQAPAQSLSESFEHRDIGRFGVRLGVLFMITLLTRLPVSNFLFEIGDAGSYVNSANSLARVGSTTTQFFPLNQMFLAMFSSLGGFEATPYGVVFAGFLSILYGYKFGQAFFGEKKWGAAIAFLVAFNVLAMWFSRVPYSETLMLAVNFGALAFYSLARKGNAPVLNYILFGLFVSLASINRVTGIVWMLLLTVTGVVTALEDRKQFRNFIPGAMIAVAGYVSSVYVALRIGPGYYMGWQIKKYIPFIDSVMDLLVFHVAWMFTALGVLYAVHKFRAPLERTWRGLARHGTAVTVLVFAVALPVAVALVSRGEDLLGMAFYSKVVRGELPQDAYFLWNYFTPLSLPLFLVGLVFLFWKKNPLLEPHAIAAWLFAFLFLVIYYTRVVYGKPHDVYLYWDRYFLSEVFLIFATVIVAGMVVAARHRWGRYLVFGFFACYFGYGAVWLSENRENSYLAGAEPVFAWMQDVVPRENSVTYLEAEYDGRWLFSNIRQSLMLPMRHSFGYQVNLGPARTDYFAGDTPISWSDVQDDLEKGRDVYVLRAVKFAAERTIEVPPGLRATLLGEETFRIEVKGHVPGHLFDKGYKSYPLHLEVYKVNDGAIVPAEVQLEGFYPDRMWTMGNGVLRGFHRCSEKGYTGLSVLTAGNHPWRNDSDRIAINVKVNGVVAVGRWVSPTRYVAELQEPVPCVSQIEISSSTFVPAELGINEDGRDLGVDVVRLKLEE